MREVSEEEEDILQTSTKHSKESHTTEAPNASEVRVQAQRKGFREDLIATPSWVILANYMDRKRRKMQRETLRTRQRNMVWHGDDERGEN